MKAKLVLAHWLLSERLTLLVAVEELDDLVVGLFESVVVADDGGVLGHGLAELAPDLEGVFGACVVEQALVDLLLALAVRRRGRRRPACAGRDFA